MSIYNFIFFFFSSRRRHTRSDRDWSSDVCSSDLPVRSGWTVGVHRGDECRPGGRDVTGGGAEPGGIERSVDADRIVGLDLNLLAVDLGDDTQEFELRDRVGRYVIEAAQVGSQKDVLLDHASKLDPWEPGVDRLRIAAHWPGLCKEPFK